MNRTAPRWIVKELHRLDSRLRLVWVGWKESWEVQRMIDVVVDEGPFNGGRLLHAKPIPTHVMWWPYNDPSGRMLDLLRYGDAWSAGRIKDFWRERFDEPMSKTELARRRDYQRTENALREDATKLFKREIGAASKPVSFAGATE